MSFKSVNPADGNTLGEYDAFTDDELEAALAAAADAAPDWRSREATGRAALVRRAAEVLRERAEELARLMTLEMGKPIGEARAEIGKCAWVCEHYAEQAEHYLRQGLARDPDDHRCHAYLAVCMAVRDPQSRAAERAARKVIDAHPDDPVGYLALGQVYLQRSRRREAFRMFATAREMAEQEQSLCRQLERMEPRKTPVFPSLSRNHVLNYLCGRIRAFFYRNFAS